MDEITKKPVLHLSLCIILLSAFYLALNPASKFAVCSLGFGGLGYLLGLLLEEPTNYYIYYTDQKNKNKKKLISALTPLKAKELFIYKYNYKTIFKIEPE